MRLTRGVRLVIEAGPRRHGILEEAPEGLEAVRSRAHADRAAGRDDQNARLGVAGSWVLPVGESVVGSHLWDEYCD